MAFGKASSPARIREVGRRSFSLPAMLLVLLLMGAGCNQVYGGTGGSSASSPTASPANSTTESARSAQVPDVQYETVNRAKRALTRAGLEVRIHKRTTYSYQPGTVLSQTPEGGSDAPPGATVRLTVSTVPKCLPEYPTICIKPLELVRCGDIPLDQWGFTAEAPDRDHFDWNHDGRGCWRGDHPPTPSPTPTP